MSARRYLALIQASGGYPAPGAPLEPAEAIPAPVLLHVVRAEDYERLEAERDEAHAVRSHAEKELEAEAERFREAIKDHRARWQSLNDGSEDSARPSDLKLWAVLGDAKFDRDSVTQVAAKTKERPS